MEFVVIIFSSNCPNVFNGPTLLLIDELPHYLLSADAEKIGNVTLADLMIAFVMNLISAVTARYYSYNDSSCQATAL